MAGGLGGGGGIEKLTTLFVIPDLRVVSGGYFIGTGIQIAAATTTVLNDSLVMPASNSAIINALKLAGCYDQFYTNDTTPKTVLLSDIYLTNDQVIKSGDYLALLPNSFQRNLIAALYTTKSLKRGTVNLLNDPSFAEVTKINDRSTSQLIWWEKYLPYSGANGDAISYPNDTVLINDRRYFYIQVTSGTVNAIPSTEIRQKIFLNDVATTDVLSISLYCRTNTANGGSFGYSFYDRNNNIIGTRTNINTGNTSNVWTLKKIENIPIPSSANGVMYMQLHFGTNNGNTSNYFTQPCVNIGATALAFENKYYEYTDYAGLERFVTKALAGSALTIALHGDSLTRSSDTTQTTKTSVLTALLQSEILRLFGVTPTIYNNAADGSNNILQNAILEKMALDHNPDLIWLMNGRNTDNTADEIDSKYVMEETDIVRILTHDIDTDIVASLPFYRKHDNPIAESELLYYTKDQSYISQSLALKNKYKIANIFSAQKVKAFADKPDTTITWDLFYLSDRVHLQSGGGHYIRAYELRNFIGRALRYSNVRGSLPQPINTLLSLTPLTLYPSSFGVVANTVKSGTWINDANVTMNGTTYTASGVSLGEYDQPIVSSAQGDYLEVTWTGKHFAILFIPSSNRGVAKITIDGTSYDINTNGVLTNSTFQICTYSKDSLNPGISLSQGSHTLKIEQKNSEVNDKISVALVTVF